MQLWQQVCNPSETLETDLLKVRSHLARSRDAADALEQYLYTQIMDFQVLARCESDIQKRDKLRQSADTLSILMGVLFAPQKDITEKRPTRF